MRLTLCSGFASGRRDFLARRRACPRTKGRGQANPRKPAWEWVDSQVVQWPAFSWIHAGDAAGVSADRASQSYLEGLTGRPMVVLAIVRRDAYGLMSAAAESNHTVVDWVMLWVGNPNRGPAVSGPSQCVTARILVDPATIVTLSELAGGLEGGWGPGRTTRPSRIARTASSLLEGSGKPPDSNK